jgi:hypothetical protein
MGASSHLYRDAFEATIDRCASIEDDTSSHDDLSSRFSLDSRIAADFEDSFDEPQLGCFSACDGEVWHG